MAIVDSIRSEYLRYKDLAEKAIDQLSDDQLSVPGPGGGNSIAVICWHISGNLRSRFTDFLTSDGEKSWRSRDEEFQARAVTRAALLDKWETGWEALLGVVRTITDEQLETVVTIRHEPHTVHAALHRSLSHVSYHVGQIVYLAKAFRGPDWTYLTIPPGQTEAFNKRCAEAAGIAPANPV
jgi:uncharacterized damage-inducible protein DinB